MDIVLNPSAPDQALVARDLRALADLIENDSDGFTAAIVAQLFKDCAWPAHSVHYQARDGRTREIMAEAIRRFKTIASGPVAKDYRDAGDGYFDATIPLSALQIALTDLRADTEAVGR
ncbi:hypothetical protein [Nocardia sp. NBC_00511]|uniref:hypothetical protein n=1 Tax=Nocardia sp. NBC_00511 TaxID=2903591 RepID=UPI0030E5E824